MEIKLYTEYVDKVFLDLKKTFKNQETIENAFLHNPFLHYFILYDQNNLIGYLSFNVLYDRCEILCLQIKKIHRNHGYGSILMERLIQFCYHNKLKNITLEVNQSNEGAIALYQKFDFVQKAIRRKYYNGVDGILMERKMM